MASVGRGASAVAVVAAVAVVRERAGGGGGSGGGGGGGEYDDEADPAKTLADLSDDPAFHEFFKLTTKISTANMVCFDFDGKIKKYNTPEEIIEDFYPKRLAYYQKRKVRLLNQICYNAE